MNTSLELQSVRSELLTYCAGMPQGILARGPLEMAAFAVSLGNCFVWIAPHLDGRQAPQIEEPLGQVPQSIHSLGKQLRAVGLHWWNKTPGMADRETEVALLRAEVARLDKLVHRFVAERRGK